MHLSPKEINKLMLHNAGFLAQKRYARGLPLNYVETIALISTQILEFIRDGNPVAELMEKGKRILGFVDVMEGVASMIDEVQVEGTLPDGTKLVTVHHPVCREAGDSALALYGSGLVRTQQTTGTSKKLKPIYENEELLDPGQTIPGQGSILLNEGRSTVEITVVNHGDRPIQVGSHYPFFETNPALQFDRNKAFGCRLNIPAGTAVRFEPGEGKTVTLVEIAGQKLIFGGNNLTDGSTEDANKAAAFKRSTERGFAHKEAR